MTKTPKQACEHVAEGWDCLYGDHGPAPETTTPDHYANVVWVDHERHHVTWTCEHKHRTARTAHECLRRRERRECEPGMWIGNSGVATVSYEGGLPVYHPTHYDYTEAVNQYTRIGIPRPSSRLRTEVV